MPSGPFIEKVEDFAGTPYIKAAKHYCVRKQGIGLSELQPFLPTRFQGIHFMIGFIKPFVKSAE